MSYILEGIGFFLPYLAATLVLALLFGLFMHAKFAAPAGSTIAKDPAKEPWAFIVKWARATTFFFMFAAFGLVVAYFLSLGIKEESPDVWANPLVGQFATPLIALLTAGVGFFANREAPEGALMVVPAGVICFLVESIVCYRGLFLYAIGER